MANIRKSFNFRNGVQVDDDNLIVNPYGLVGIGTTIPTEALDVRGKVKVIQDPNVLGSGVLNATTGIVTSLTVVELEVNGNDFSAGVIGAGISVGKAGVITATDPTGVVTYFGDGKNLLNLPTSQWLDMDVGLGYTSIYAQGGVGISTDDPRFFLQVGGNTDLGYFADGVGINSRGGVVATGVVTATTFNGSVLGDIQGGIGTITQILSTNAHATGIVTAGIGFTGDVRGNILSGISTIVQIKSTNAHVTGIVTAGIGFTGNLTGNVVGHIEGNVVGNVDSVGVSTFHELKVTGSISGDTVSGILTTGDLTSSRSVLGISTASKLHVTNQLGVGINNPLKQIEVFSVGISTVDIQSEETAILQLSQKSSVGIGESTAQFKFGQSPKTLDIINGDTGNVNTVIHGGGFVGVNTGSFNWVYGKTNTNLMTLDYKGNLGINKIPEYPLDVAGIATFSDNVYIKTNLDVEGDAIIDGNLTVSGITQFSLPDLISSNINSSSGISTFLNIHVEQIISGVTTIGIGTALENIGPNIDLDCPFGTAVFNKVGIGSTQPMSQLDVAGSIQGKSFFGIGESLACAVDFSSAGKNLGGALGNKSFMVPPRVTNTERNNLINIIGGAMVYNTTNSKLQVYVGSYPSGSWVNLH